MKYTNILICSTDLRSVSSAILTHDESVAAVPVPTLIAHNPDPASDKVAAPMGMPVRPYSNVPRIPARLTRQLRRKRRIRRMLLSGELGIGCAVDSRGLVREHDDLALRFLCCDPCHCAIKSCDVGPVCSDVGIGVEALDTLEVL